MHEWSKSELEENNYDSKLGRETNALPKDDRFLPIRIQNTKADIWTRNTPYTQAATADVWTLPFELVNASWPSLADVDTGVAERERTSVTSALAVAADDVMVVWVT